MQAYDCPTSSTEQRAERREEARKEKDKKANAASWFRSYNRYLAVAARVVRRSLKEESRIVAERRGVQDLRFAKWSVSGSGNLDLAVVGRTGNTGG